MEPQIQKKIKKDQKNTIKNSTNQDDILLFQPTKLLQTSVLNQFGNYKDYYKSRKEYKFQDQRISQLDQNFFENKQVIQNYQILDIGCNDGSLSIQLAIKYFPQNIQGIDIDHKLVEQATKNVKYFTKQQKLCKPDVLQPFQDKIKQLPRSFQLEINKKEYLIKQNNFPYNINFKVSFFIQCENYIQTPVDKKYDTIMCLSVSKWIHLNFGDEGLMRLFNKIYRQLKEQGIFIFEFQDWKSYKKRRNLCELIKKNYQNIKLRPESFLEILTQQGFVLIDQFIGQFKRQMLILQKK